MKFNSYFKSKRKCAKCGKTEIIDKKINPVIGTREKADNHVWQCSNCKIFICGTCAMKSFDLYVSGDTPRGRAESANLAAITKWLKGEDARDIIDKTNEASGGDLVVSYKCSRCGSDLVS